MRRLIVGLALAAVMVSAPAAAQENPTIAFATALESSDMGGALGAWGANLAGATERERLHDAIAADRDRLAGVVPDACLLPTYVGYLEALTYADVALTLFEAFLLEASASVQNMVAAKIGSLDPESLVACL